MQRTHSSGSRSRCNDQTIVLTCSGRLGDDEVVCRWKRIPNTVKRSHRVSWLILSVFLESMDEWCDCRAQPGDDVTHSSALRSSAILERSTGSFGQHVLQCLEVLKYPFIPWFFPVPLFFALHLITIGYEIKLFAILLKDLCLRLSAMGVLFRSANHRSFRTSRLSIKQMASSIHAPLWFVAFFFPSFLHAVLFSFHSAWLFTFTPVTSVGGFFENDEPKQGWSVRTTLPGETGFPRCRIEQRRHPRHSTQRYHAHFHSRVDVRNWFG